MYGNNVADYNLVMYIIVPINSPFFNSSTIIYPNMFNVISWNPMNQTSI